ncbi:MAG: hypothetical protein ACPGXL_06540 [Chitinophagales bacterium]
MTVSKSRKPYYIVLILLLLLINGLLFFQSQSLKKQKNAAIENLEDEKSQLEAEYQVLLNELEAYKIENLEMDSTLTSMQEDIDSKKAQINKMLRSSESGKYELAEARKLLSSLRAQSTDYKQQVDALRYENQQLTNANQNLEGENTTLKEDVGKKSEQITSLESDKADLSDAKKQLEAETSNLKEVKGDLESKVNRASVMRLGRSIVATGVRSKGNGDEVATDNFKRTEKIKVCFDVLPNAVAPVGNKEIILRLTGPNGAPLSVDALGSGVFTIAETGETARYTTKAKIQYNKQEESYCMYWEQNSPFTEGTYKAELFHEGYDIGKTNFVLKKKIF